MELGGEEAVWAVGGGGTGDIIMRGGGPHRVDVNGEGKCMDGDLLLQESSQEPATRAGFYAGVWLHKQARPGVARGMLSGSPIKWPAWNRASGWRESVPAEMP